MLKKIIYILPFLLLGCATKITTVKSTSVKTIEKKVNAGGWVNYSDTLNSKTWNNIKHPSPGVVVENASSVTVNMPKTVTKTGTAKVKIPVQNSKPVQVQLKYEMKVDSGSYELKIDSVAVEYTEKETVKETKIKKTTVRTNLIWKDLFFISLGTILALLIPYLIRRFLK